MAEYEVARRLNQSTNEWETVVVDETGGGGGSLAITGDGTTVDPVTLITLSGAEVVDAGGGQADVTIAATPPPLADVLATGSDGGGTGAFNFGSLDTGGSDISTGDGAIDAGTGNLSCGKATIDGNLDHNGSGVGFYGTAPAARQTVAFVVDPATATAEEVANALNALLTKLSNAPNAVGLFDVS